MTSDISTNSKFKIFLATLGASVAAGLKVPGLLRATTPAVRGEPLLPTACHSTDAAAASRSRPVSTPALGVNVGSSAGTLSRGRESVPVRSASREKGNG